MKYKFRIIWDFDFRDKSKPYGFHLIALDDRTLAEFKDYGFLKYVGWKI